MVDRTALAADAEQAILGALQAIRALKAAEAREPASPHAAPAVAPAAAVPAAHGLRDPAAFFDHMRGTTILGPKLSTEEVTGCGAIMEACAAAVWPIAWTAYALATAYHETAGTMQPIREYGRGKGRRYGKPGPHGGQIAYGRGLVQLTWPENYQTMDDELGLGGSLVGNYDRALEPDLAAQIMIVGMQKGKFTSKKLADTLPEAGPADLNQFIASRPIINGRDKDRLIGGHAMTFQEALMKGKWT